VNLPDDALEELWTLYDASGLRPEWVLPGLYLESGFNPALRNGQGAPYYGVAQDFGPYLTRHGIAPGDYLAMSAQEQLAAIVAPRLETLAKAWGPLRSATRVYQANFQPATLKRTPGLWSVILWRGSPDYASNTILDVLRDGAITVSDLAWWMMHEAAAPECAAAIARAYVLRPVSPMPSLSPAAVAYGGDFVDPLKGGAVVGLVGGLAALLAR